MRRPPKVRYAKSGDVSIAWQSVGSGPDLLLVPGWVSHLEYAWEEPDFAAFLDRLASFSRLILLDRRGTGLSDRVAEMPTLEQRMDDVRAVMDAAGSERAALFGISEGGPMCILFAATFPARTSALMMYGTYARAMASEDYPWGHAPATVTAFLEVIKTQWGTGITARAFAPSIAADVAETSWGRFERLAVSPGSAQMLLRMAMDCDVRAVLPTVRVPTLVLHRVDDLMVPVGGARAMAAAIPGAVYRELPGADHFAWVGDVESVLGEVEEFVTGARRGPDPDRVLSTVLFTDIVGSTARASGEGDQGWRVLLDRHDDIVRRELGRHRGIEIKMTGDGVLATFDGPARAVRCALAIRDAVRPLGLEIRAGLHTGEIELRRGDIGGIAVHIGERVCADAAPGEVLVSGTVKDLVVGSGLVFAERGARVLAGISGDWPLYAAGE